ncbi:MAG TPA: D-alanyl-D-alanine carboxypeptidase family protein [Nitrospirota bacterium]|jgi:D-alanyl-D-alanine carboxypeptidase (penicillin-binding protein 5/6)
MMGIIKTVLFSMAAVVLSCGMAFAEGEDALSVTAKGVVVMDADTGQVIISRNMDKMLPPASTTKVMTAILAIEKAKPTDIVKVSKHAADMSPSKVYLRRGDEVTVEALLYSLLLKSANDSAAALAEGVGGTEDNFARMMTDKARSIGALNTHFNNASGLPTDDHYTTAYDLALILRYAMRNEQFMQISSTKFATLNMGAKEKMLLKNHNKMLWYYDGAGAGKTGYTVAARHCYVGEANCSNTRLIVSILRSRDLWGDAKKLLDKGFELAMAGQTLALADTPDEPVVSKASYHGKHKAHKKTKRSRKKKRTY